jgi:hypothetical protein
MPRDLIEVIDNYEYQLRHGGSKLRQGSTVEAQVSRFAEGRMRDSVLVEMTKQALNSAGIPTIQYPAYYAFTRKLNKRLNGPDGPRLTGDSASAEAATHVAQWIARGLCQSVLASIVVNVLNVSYPPRP